jgi:hypothetical protein
MSNTTTFRLPHLLQVQPLVSGEEPPLGGNFRLNGMHRYNNQDQSMVTATLVVQDVLAGKRVYDVWRVNEDTAYFEAGRAGDETVSAGERGGPRKRTVSLLP